ncbi:GGDEF domain-containing protein [Legionella worsleiensis]|uniref:Putative regulatory protein (GGDEF domain) n=1 Tax=Legionella worsleiensis TaxID=45076 RepID=A0A0W1A624_9GAMM|nr:GGDEF domain-containing protein [Legionella worsleiensis]KTD76795.1 putative regulatory protein (GGDEF domain) [Legionella worsleiensis]STY30631.1 putative regulatory protein [Legionella worsleiensis]
MTNKRTKSDDKIRQKIQADKLVLLSDNLLISIPPNFVCSLIVFIELYTQLNPAYSLIWFFCALVAFAVQVCAYIINRFNKLPSKGYLILLIALAVVYGALWGIAGSILMPDNNMQAQMLIMIITLGVTAGGLLTFQPNLTAGLLFLSLIILPINYWLFIQSSSTYFLLGIALAIYLCFIIMVTWRGNKLLNVNLKLRFENLDLIDRLVSNNTILEESESRFRSAFDFAAIGMAIVSLEGKWLKVNQSMCQIVGYSEDELLKIDFQTITHPDDLKLDLSYVNQLLAGEINSYHLEKRYIKKDGSIIWILLSGSLIRNKENKPLYFIAQVQNIDAQKNAEQELKYIAFHDVLTGLGNRKQLELSFKHALSYAKRHQNQIAILFMDLDSFKPINDTLGHDIGDLLLIEIGSRLKKTIRATDILIRQGGDEFIIALTEVSDNAQIDTAAKKILTTIRKPIKIKGNQFSITMSIGISVYPKDGQDLNTLIKQADKALYLVKSGGRNNYSYFE